ncbi:hypothetical protein PENTCL1PPCAC_18359, partial [Pristionchus entomophagus]
AGWILCSLAVLLAAQSSLAEEIGEISDDNFDQPPLSSSGEVEGKSTTKEGVKGVKKSEEDNKKELNAAGSVEKGEKSGGKVDGKKPIKLSGSGEKEEKGMTKAEKTIGQSGSGEKGEKEMTKAAKTPGLSASNEKKLNETMKAEKVHALEFVWNTSLPDSAEMSVKDSPKGEKIVMVSSTDSEKKDKEQKTEGHYKSIVAPSSETTTETSNKIKSTSTEKKGSSEKKEEKELKEVKKPADDKATTHQETTTVVTTVNLPLSEDSDEKAGMVDGEGEGASDEQDEPEGEQVKGEKKEKKKEEKKEEKVEEKRPYPIQIKDEYYSDSHFFSFFIFFIVISAVGYLAYHNKRKIMALLIEGRSGKGGRVRYHRLANDDNFERNVIY